MFAADIRVWLRCGSANADKSAAVAEMFNSFTHDAASLQREVGLGVWHS
jgi:hypothetical protein